jgi:hypothetical protein
MAWPPQREVLLEAGGDAAGAALSGLDDQQVGPHRVEAVHDLLLRPAADGEHRDHGADADDDPEHREDRAQLAREQALDADFEHGPEQHDSGPRRDGEVLDDAPVAQAHLAAAERRDLRVVRHDHDGVPLFVQGAEQRGSPARCGCRGCRWASSAAAARVHQQRPRDCDRWRWPPESWFGFVV